MAFLHTFTKFQLESRWTRSAVPNFFESQNLLYPNWVDVPLIPHTFEKKKIF